MTPENNTKQKILAVLTVIFLFIIVGSLFFLISLNNKEETTTLRSVVRQQVKEQKITQKLLHIKLATSTPVEITSKSFLTLAFTDSGTKKIVAEKNPDLVLPIASITKLMTAVIAMENTAKETKVTATLDYIGKDESAFILETDKTYLVKDLLANALISSDNDSARLLSSVLGEVNFISKMNLKAQALGMTQTKFINVTGLDPVDNTIGPVNVSTAADLSKLITYIINAYPQILQAAIQPTYNFCDINNYCKEVTNTNKLLANSDFRFKIIGGKTGSTDMALKNLILLMKPLDDIFLLNIVLGAEDNFKDTETLISQVIIQN